jgi:putative peptidoglycan lipid II flippase
MFGMILVAQIAGIFQANVASLAAGTEAPSLAVLRFSWLIFMLPHSVVAVSLATAYFTRMSQHASARNYALVQQDFQESTGRIGFFMVLAQTGLIVVALPFARQFGVASDAIEAMGTVIVLYVLGLVPFSVLFVVQRVFYALEDTRTPFFIQVFQATLFIVFALVVSTFPTSSIAFGLALSTTLAGLAQTLLALVLLRRKLGGLGLRVLVKKYSLFALAALPAGAAGAGVLVFLGGRDPHGFLLSHAVNAGLGMGLITVVMSFVYAVVLLLFKSSDAQSVINPVLRRLGIRRGGNTSP